MNKIIKNNLYTWKEISGFCDISSGLTVGQNVAIRVKIKDLLTINEDYKVNKYDEVMFFGSSINKIKNIVQEYKSKIKNKKQKL